MKNKNCPICDKNMIYLERYPKMICNQCIELAVNKNGESIKFYNINNRKCLAGEARFGGIVVELSE